MLSCGDDQGGDEPYELDLALCGVVGRGGRVGDPDCASNTPEKEAINNLKKVNLYCYMLLI